MAKLQAANVPIAYAGTDRRTDGWIAVSLNAPYSGGHKKDFLFFIYFLPSVAYDPEG